MFVVDYGLVVIWLRMNGRTDKPKKKKKKHAENEKNKTKQMIDLFAIKQYIN